MLFDVLFVLALSLPGRPPVAPAPQTPQALFPTTTAPASFAAPKSPPSAPLPATPAAPDAPLQEHLTRFDAGLAALDWSSQDWRVVADGVVLKDFGRRESEARQALRLIRELRLNQHGTIGGPSPTVEYWLSDGQPPQGRAAGLHLLAMDAASLRVEQTQAQWVLRDDQRVLFNFGREEDDARQALAVVRKYGFTQVGVVGPAVPSMMVFFSRPEMLSNTGPLQAARSPAPADSAAPGGKPQAGRPDAPPDAVMAPAVPPLRQAAVSDNILSATSATPDRTPFDFRQVQLVEEKGAWKLAAGSFVLADFGADQYSARLGLSAVQYYRFTEQCRVGPASGGFSYFLAGGQAPRGVMFGVDGQSFLPNHLEVRQVGGRWAVCAGEQPLVDMGDRQEEAQQVLEVMRRQQFDRLCRLATADGKGMTFLVRSH